MKIMTVDDDPIALGILETVLRQAQYQDLTPVLSAEAALEEVAAAQTPFECFLLDIRMPGMDGIELCAKLRAMAGYEDVPIIMTTAVTDKTRLNQALQAGATDYVNKPLDGIELGTRLRAAGQLSALLAGAPRLAPGATERPAGLGDPSGLRLPDAISLDPAPGIHDLEKLRSALLALPSGLYSTVVLGCSVLHVETAFEALPAARFRAFLNDIGRTLAEEFATETFHIAYAGNGTFATVLHKARQQKPHMVKQRLGRAIADLEPPAELSEEFPGIELAFGEGSSKGPMTGHGAAVALSEAIQAAGENAQTQAQRHRLSDLRKTLRPGKGRARTAFSQVLPRRLAPNLFRPSREENA
ncbi:response regulator [Rhodobacteraceae bacterium 63075]|nr:response regulator [Rhodobacteraceae bacterium 63075]